jgi:tetratricopeptide (TPR) repeat protein
MLYARRPDTLEQARASFERALGAGYRKPDVLKNLGSVEIKLGRFSEAVEHLQAALDSAPDYAEAYFLLADGLRKSGQAGQSAEAMKRFQSLNAAAADRKQRETRGQDLYQQGMDLLSKEDLGKAYEAFRQAVEISPQLDSAHYRMAQIDNLSGNNRRALESIRQALQLNPFEPEFYFVLARCLEDTDVAGALDAAAKAVSLNPAVADFHNLAGMLFDKTSDYRRAVESYRRAVELEPRNEAFQANLAAAVRKLKER